MKIALIGYGKMGKTVEAAAIVRKHEIVLTIDAENRSSLTAENIQKADVAIEFTGPDTAFTNIEFCLQNGVPVVCGSTGWMEKMPDATRICEVYKSALLVSSNFSVGVNIFFELNRMLAKLMADMPAYRAEITEVHHTQKKDAPSGTAITLAEQIMTIQPKLKQWVNSPSNAQDQLPIISKRIDPAPGTHHVLYRSEIDDIEIIHTAHNRKGFALGAVLAAEFLINKQGVYSMQDVLRLSA
ncbi:MAG: 4-hydroxy-tetrahydrodipicolinate reductase [Chitinophagaceae bacterium]